MAIEQFSPDLERIVSPGQELEVLGTGYGGEGGPAEGPLWWKEGGYLLFSDIANNSRMKWTPGEGTTLFSQPTNNANGLTRDPQGRIVACEHGTRRVTRLEAGGSVTVVADRYQGKRLNRPNDVVVKTDGGIYFTDPGGRLPPEEREQEFSGVYRVSPDLSNITVVATDFEGPNGLAFSPDESVLYVDNTRQDQYLKAFDVQPDGSLANGRVLLEMGGDRRGVPDGMKVDVEGNIYCTAPGGVWIIDPSGRHLGTILVGDDKQATNVAWGDDDLRTLYITEFNALYRIRLKIPGLPVPR